MYNTWHGSTSWASEIVMSGECSRSDLAFITVVNPSHATVFSAAASLYVPEPVALSTCGSGRCKAVVRSTIKPLLDDSLPTTVRRALLLLHERILTAIQAIGQREAAFDYSHSRQALRAQKLG
jgi:hypothetical protein